MAMGPPGPPEPLVAVFIWPGTLSAGLVGGVSAVPRGYICVSRGSAVTINVKGGYVGSGGTAFECMCLKPTMHTSGSRKFNRVISVPGVDPRDTMEMQLTGLPSGIIFAPPLIALGSLNILSTSACIASHVSGEA